MDTIEVVVMILKSLERNYKFLVVDHVQNHSHQTNLANYEN